MGNDELSVYQKEAVFNLALENLRGLLKADAEATRLLIHHHVPCNKEVEDDTTMIPGANLDGSLRLGLMGIINGILEPITGERIAALISDFDGCQILGFEKYQPGKRYD